MANRVNEVAGLDVGRTRQWNESGGSRRRRVRLGVLGTDLAPLYHLLPF